jgi:hypothetical protein
MLIAKRETTNVSRVVARSVNQHREFFHSLRRMPLTHRSTHEDLQEKANDQDRQIEMLLAQMDQIRSKFKFQQLMGEGHYDSKSISVTFEVSNHLIQDQRTLILEGSIRILSLQLSLIFHEVESYL